MRFFKFKIEIVFLLIIKSTSISRFCLPKLSILMILLYFYTIILKLAISLVVLLSDDYTQRIARYDRFCIKQHRVVYRHYRLMSQLCHHSQSLDSASRHFCFRAHSLPFLSDSQTIRTLLYWCGPSNNLVI